MIQYTLNLLDTIKKDVQIIDLEDDTILNKSVKIIDLLKTYFNELKEHIWLPASMHFECKSCHSRRSLRSGTIMHGSKLSFLYWFKTIHLLTSTKKTFSASEMQRQLGIVMI